MKIVDFSQVVISNIMAMYVYDNSIELKEDMFRHMVLNTLRRLNVMFKDKGEMVIACDSRTYWRRMFFKNYKSQRSEDRRNSPYDWDLIYKYMDMIIAELKENFPYRVVQVDKAEADDVIAVITKRYGEVLNIGEPIIIISGDKDFQQLQKYGNVEQYNPRDNKYIKTANPTLFLKEHIIRGDSGDGVPNILSDDDTFVKGVRQKKIYTSKLNTWLTQKPEHFCDEKMLKNFQRNSIMIDFECIPKEVSDNINEAFDKQQERVNNRSKLFNYFMHFRLKTLHESIGDF